MGIEAGDLDLDKVQRRRPGYVVLTTNLLVALSKYGVYPLTSL